MSKTIFEAYNHCKKQLLKAGIEDYAYEARVIIRHITGYSNSQILSKYSNTLTAFQENNLTAIIHQREVRYPLQYILGEWSFYGRDFFVGPGVLIPRADTETVIDAAKELIKTKKAPKILDLCAGSGCIGITLAAECQDADITMVEKYDEAINYTKKNIERNNVNNAKIIKGDVLETAAKGKYDLVVSNPPYVTNEEMQNLQPEVKFEPETALRAEDNGLEFYRAIAKNYKECLLENGSICFEVGFAQAEAVAELLKQEGYSEVTIKNDANDVQRVVFGTLKSI